MAKRQERKRERARSEWDKKTTLTSSIKIEAEQMKDTLQIGNV